MQAQPEFNGALHSGRVPLEPRSLHFVLCTLFSAPRKVQRKKCLGRGVPVGCALTLQGGVRMRGLMSIISYSVQKMFMI
jgi:hypothetical protein